MTFLFRLFPFVVLVGLFTLCLRAAVRVTGLFLHSILVMIAGAIGAGLAGMVAAALAGHFGVEPSWLAGVLTGMGVFTGVGWWNLRRLGRRMGAAVGLARAQAPAIETEPAVAEAWDAAMALVPGGRDRLQAARIACARVGALADDSSLDPALIECAVFVRRNVPELVGTTRAMLADAARADRPRLLEELATDLEQIGRRALGEVERVRGALDDRRTAVRAHVAQRTGDPV